MRYLLVFCLLCWLPANAKSISAKSYIVMKIDGTVLLEKDADESRSIASITKLVTTERAAAQAAEEMIVVEKEDIREGRMRSTPLRAGVAYPRGMLIELALVSSDNVAALALGRNLPDGSAPPNIHIVESSGLHPENQSTARHLANYARHLQNSPLAAISVLPTTSDGKRRSTNPMLLRRGWEFFLSKTGFINKSGGCMVVITKIKSELVAVVILGSSDTRQRWRDLASLRTLLGDTDFAMLEEKRKRKRP